MRIALIGLAALIAAAASGCSTVQFQAPYDGFVCYNSSFDNCLGLAQSGQLNAFRSVAYRTAQALASTARTDDGQVIKTADAKYECDYGQVPYSAALKRDEIDPAVVVSPTLIKQIGEQELRLERTRTGCNRLVEVYDHQIRVLALQDRISAEQKAISVLNGEIETERLSKEGFGSRQLTADEATQYGASGTVRDALKAERAALLTDGESLRGVLKEQATEVDFRRQFEDANLAIDLQLRALARDLFILDRSPIRASGGHAAKYANGAWIKQGTIIYLGKPKS